jgi:tetratricopeptide (TPR) repeat protein
MLVPILHEAGQPGEAAQYLDDALVAIQSVNEFFLHFRLLVLAHFILAGLDQKEKANKILDEALVIGRKAGLLDESMQGLPMLGDEDLSMVTISLVQSGHVREAIVTAHSSVHPSDRYHAFENIVRFLIYQRRLDEALGVAYAIPDTCYGPYNFKCRSAALKLVIPALAEAGKVGEHFHVALATMDDYDRSVTSRDAISALARKGQPDEALATLQQTTPYDSHRIHALISVADAYERAMQADRAVALLEEATTLFPNCTGEECSRDTVVVSNALNKLGHSSKAKEILEQRLIHESSFSKDNINVLTLLSDAFRKIGDVNKAEEILNRALTDARNVKEEFDRANELNVIGTLVLIADSFRRAGQMKQAKTVLTEALTAARGIKEDLARSKAFAQVAAEFAHAFSFRQARLIANLCTQSIDKLTAYTNILNKFAEPGIPGTSKYPRK